MAVHGVTLPVMAGVPVDCAFWLEDDGWTGVCDRLAVTVRGSSFGDAKTNLEGALQEQIERLLREHFATSIRLSA